MASIRCSRTGARGYILTPQRGSTFTSWFDGAHPAEAAVEEPESVEIGALKLHVNLVAVHLAIERQLILAGALKREARFPRLAVALGEHEGVVVDVDRDVVARK